MHLTSSLLFCFLAAQAVGQSHQISATNADPPSEKIYYITREVYLESNFTILDESNGDVVSIGAGNSHEIVEVKPGERHRWFFERLTARTHIVRDMSSTKFIHFPTIKDNAVATLSETAATLFECVVSPNMIFNISATDGNPRDGPLAWTVETYSPSDSRQVLKLRKWSSGRERQGFIMVKQPSVE